VLSLDREDFVLLRHQTAATDLYNETIMTSVYYPECEQLAPDRRPAIALAIGPARCGDAGG